MTKELKVSVIIDVKEAQAEITKLTNFITQRFIEAGERIAKTIGYLPKSRKQFDISKEQEGD